ncbi:MAG: hypothetical protein JWN86_3659 [Planctomycetota bacterium]|nr:hypothetical protein [Planctomycetota bacterium]
MATNVQRRTLVTPVGFRAAFRLSDLARLVLLVALCGLTAWVGLQRPALRDAEGAFSRKDVRNALRFALDDLASYPSSPVSNLIAARSFSKLVYGAEAEPYYERVGSAASLPQSALDDRVNGLIVSNQLDRAVAVCDEVLSTRPSDPLSLRWLAFVQWLRSQFVEAQAAAERLADTPEGRKEGLGLLAMIHHEAKHPEQAIAAYESLLSLDPELKSYRPGPAIFWREFTDDLVKVHRNLEARTYLEKVAPLYSDPGLLDILAWARKELGDEKGAENAWRESIVRDSGRLNPRLQLGRLFVGRKRFADAVAVLEPATALDPANLDCHHLLSTAYKFLGRNADSQRHQKIADEIRHTSPDRSGGMGPSK